LLKAAPEAEAYTAERKTADEKMAALSKHAAVGSWAKYCRDSATARFGGEAGGRCHQPGRLDAGAQDYKQARAVLARVMVDLNNAAKTCRPGERPSGHASGAGKDADAAKKAIAKLRKQAEAIAKGEHADQVKDELGKNQKKRWTMPRRR